MNKSPVKDIEKIIVCGSRGNGKTLHYFKLIQSSGLPLPIYMDDPGRVIAPRIVGFEEDEDDRKYRSQINSKARKLLWNISKNYGGSTSK